MKIVNNRSCMVKILLEWFPGTLLNLQNMLFGVISTNISYMQFECFGRLHEKVQQFR